MTQQQILDELRAIALRHGKARRTPTAIANLTLMRAEAPTPPVQTVYQSGLVAVIQGRKRGRFADVEFEYHPAQYLLTTVDMPVSGEIIEASPEQPYLSIGLTLDPAVLAALMLDLPDVQLPDAGIGLGVYPMHTDLLEALLRLVRLLDRPQEIGVLAALAEREILYRLLLDNPALRQLAQMDSRMAQINRAIGWIRENYAQPFSIEALAAVSMMSASSLHRHFKAVTRLSPLQFQKRIRLQIARQMLAGQSTNAAGVGFAVGYDSPSQFSREYRRLYGEPPARDTARLRTQPNLQAV
ncbi:AraC family transcriptional regulator [Amantichitinum ursilacus]|uniref:HTH-type transcriptional activator RhaS n=1 Tax=Amantichitinum ursilacus TaxID=857265 RepID=A0A0N1JT81_9NEIS|nr:AraC family transcriptional regulator [Amantichitinum ursilacus]KPC53728.1 HTH-type transcriptional activator RhaS [Amantichitinum ursilacus]